MPLNAEQKRLLTTVAQIVGNFSGKSGFPAIKWLRDFERVVRVYDTPQIVLPLFKLAMKDTAADWLVKQNDDIQNDFDLLRTQFLNRFVPNEFQDELEPLLRRKQHSTENVRSYADYFQEIIAQMTDPPNPIKLCKIFESQLLPEIQSRLSVRNWDNLNDLIAEAKLVESKLYLPLLSSSIPVTTQLTEALAYRQKEGPSAIYQQALSEIQPSTSKAEISKSNLQRSFGEPPFDIQKYVQSEIEAAFNKFNSSTLNNLATLVQQPRQSFPFRKPFVYPNQIFWCDYHGEGSHSSKYCFVLNHRYQRQNQQYYPQRNQNYRRTQSIQANQQKRKWDQTEDDTYTSPRQQKVANTPQKLHRQEHPDKNLKTTQLGNTEMELNVNKCVSENTSESFNVPFKSNSSNHYTAMQLLQCVDAQGHELDIIGDSGCSHAAIDLDFTLEHQLPITECSNIVKLGNSITTTALGKTHFTFSYKGNNFSFDFLGAHYKQTHVCSHSLILIGESRTGCKKSKYTLSNSNFNTLCGFR